MRTYILKQWKSNYVLWIIGLIMPSIFSLLSQYMSARLGENIIKKVTSGNSFLLLVVSCIVLLIGYIVSEVLWGCAKYCLSIVKMKLECGMKEKVFNKVLRTEYNHIVGINTGEAFMQYNSDVDTMVNLITDDIYNILYSLIMGIGISFLIMNRNILIGCIIFVLTVIVLLLHNYYVNVFKELEKKDRAAREQQIGGFSQVILGKDMIRQLEIQDVMKEDLQDRISRLLEVRLEGNRMHLKKGLRMDWFIYACATLILPISCLMASLGKINLFDTIFIVQLAGNIIWSTKDLGSAIIEYNRKKVAIDSIEAMMAKPEDSFAEPLKISTSWNDNEEIALEFKNVTIRYKEFKPVDNLSFQCERGTITLVMGKSGIGKSTILNGILLFSEHSGDIYVKGKKVTKENIREIRNSIAYVSEHCELDDGSIRDNIQIGNSKVLDLQIEERMERFGLTNLQDGREENILDISCGTRGENLSGGEKQRISIIRAIIKESDILLLDEPTASLDKDTEEIVLNELLKLKERGKTIIIVTHRENSKRIADKIINL